MSTNRTYAQRLFKLADFLDTLKPSRFRYDKWVGDSWQRKQDLSCGTTACAMGWAATMPAFRRLGLHLFDDGIGVIAMRTKGDGVLLGISVCTELFNIDAKEAEYLFIPLGDRFEVTLDETCGMGPSTEATAKQVARHIRRFVRFRFLGLEKYKDLPTP